MGVDQARRRGTRALVLLIGETGRKRPRLAFAQYRGTPGLDRFQRQRAIGGRVEIADVARHLEQRTLRGKHCPIHHYDTSSGHGTMVDFTVFIAMASATADAIPSSENG